MTMYEEDHDFEHIDAISLTHSLHRAMGALFQVLNRTWDEDHPERFMTTVVYENAHKKYQEFLKQINRDGRRDAKLVMVDDEESKFCVLNINGENITFTRTSS